MPLLGAIAGCHCEKAIAGCHCVKKLARVIHHSPLHLSPHCDNTRIGLCYLGSMLVLFSGRQPRSYTASVRHRTSTTRECRERPWKLIQKIPGKPAPSQKKTVETKRLPPLTATLLPRTSRRKNTRRRQKLTKKNNTCKDTQCTPLQPFS